MLLYDPVCSRILLFFYLMADELFVRVPRLRVMICRQCRYGVWPAEAERHLKRQHQLDHRTVRSVIQTITQWTDIAHERQGVPIPYTLDEPLPIIPSYS